MAHRYKLGEQVRLTQRGLDRLRTIFGNITGADDAWTVIGHTSSSMLFPTYTLKSKLGTQYQGIDEEHIERIPYYT